MSGEPALGKPPEAEKPSPIPPTIDRKKLPAASGEAQKPTDPNFLALSR